MAEVYLDYNATTPLDPEVLEAISSSLRDLWGNPSSGYSSGKSAKAAIENARSQTSQMIGAKPEDIVFTSGGTESNNIVFYSVVKNSVFQKPHIITSSIEHDSVLLPLRHMSEEGRIELTTLLPDVRTGSVGVESVRNAVQESTVLVSVMLANNETGIIQPVEGIKQLVSDLNSDRNNKIYLHSDAAQAIGKVPVDVEILGVDYLTIVGHKFYGPRIGALYVRGLERGETPLYHMFYGGGQERGYRPGTENTGMIVGLGKAGELVSSYVVQYQSLMTKTRDYLETRLKELFGDKVVFNSHFPDQSKRLPNTCNMSLRGQNFKGNKVISSLKHCQISVGAACHSNLTNRPSPILIACGIPHDVAINALRISVGRETSIKDIDLFVEDLVEAVETLND